MVETSSRSLLLSLCTFALLAGSVSPSVPGVKEPPDADRLPGSGLAFEENLGQFDPEVRFAIVPARTPSGPRVLLHPEPMLSLAEVIGLVARGHAVHPTVPRLQRLAHRDDLVFVPSTDLPPLSLGLVWRTATENARIRAFADVCRAIGPPVSEADLSASTPALIEGGRPAQTG